MLNPALILPSVVAYQEEAENEKNEKPKEKEEEEEADVYQGYLRRLATFQMCQLGGVADRMQRQGEIIGAYVGAAQSAAQGVSEVFERFGTGHEHTKEGGVYGDLHGQFLKGVQRIKDSPQCAEWTGEDGFGFNVAERFCCAPRFRPAVAAFAESISQPRKRRSCSRPQGPVLTAASETRMTDPINSLPDECLQEIFKYLPRAQDRCACAFVSMRWLMLQSRMHRHDFETSVTKCECSLQQDSECVRFESPSSESEVAHNSSAAVLGGLHDLPEVQGPVLVPSGKDNPGADEPRVERQPQWAMGELSRSLEGRKATDVQLAFMALGTLACGGLGKLTIKGGAASNGEGVSNDGLLAIGNCCAALRSLTLWDCLKVGDEGLAAIGNGCRLLETLDLLKCPKIGNAGIKAISRGCPLLSTISLDSCPRIGDEGLISVGKWCSALLSVAVSNCALIGSKGIAAVGAGCKKVKKLKLERINVSDEGLALLGEHCKALVKVKLANLKCCTEAGIMALFNGAGLQQLRSLSIFACSGITDLSLEEVGKVCRYLKLCALSQCPMLTDEGLKAFLQFCPCLVSLQLERCNAITHTGLIAALTDCKPTLQMLGLSKCNGVQDQGLLPAEFQLNPLTLKSLRIMYCKGLGDDGLAVIGRCCPSLEHLNLSGLVDVTDEAVMMILQGSGRKLVSLNLSGCVKISNLSICAVAKYCAEHLMSLVLDGCRNVGDESLQLVAVECKSLEELDVSQTSITDDGVRTLVEARGPCLQNLTLSGCNFLTDRSLSLIGQSCPFLGALNLKHCPQLTHVALNNLESRLMDCELLYC